MKKKFMLVILISLIPTVSIADLSEHGRDVTKLTPIETLSPELRQLLSSEMKALQEGMMSIIPMYISGQWGNIEATAKKMKDSYILKQQLSKKQLKELHTMLPQSFIKKDKEFHYLAGMLEHVAKEKKVELINFYFSELTKSCVGCHSDFAIHKFPKLKSDEDKGDDHH